MCIANHNCLCHCICCRFLLCSSSCFISLLVSSPSGRRSWRTNVLWALFVSLYACSFFMSLPFVLSVPSEPANVAMCCGPAECARRVSIRRPLSGDEACQTGTRELTDSKASAASAHSAGQAPKYRPDDLRASNFRFCSDFKSIFSVSKNL